MVWNTKQFVFLEEKPGPLTEFHRKLAATLEVVRVEEWISNEQWIGRPLANRKALVRAFVGKAVYNVPTTRAFRDRIMSDTVLRRMCGWEKRSQVPSEATFPRAFTEFAEKSLPEVVQKALIGRTLFGHLFGWTDSDLVPVDLRIAP